MPKTMSASEMIFDFLTTVFIIALSSFCFYYFIVAGHYQVAEKITRAAASFSLFSLFFTIKLKVEKRKIFRSRREASLDDVLVYFTENDKTKDLIVTILLPIVMAAVALYDSEISAVDQWQMGVVFFSAYFWHLFLFRKKQEYGGVMSATVYDRIKDQIFIFFLPVLPLATALFNREFNVVDQIQIVSVFIIMYYWHKYLIRKKE